MTASVVEERINNILNGGNYKLAIDMGKVEYISSAGLRILLTALKKTKKEKGDLRLAGLTNPIKHVFDLAGFTQFFNIYPSFEEAVASFQ